jgi:hypothetical protein
MKAMKLIPMNISLLNHQLALFTQEAIISRVSYFESVKKYYKMSLVCTLDLRALRRYFGAESQDFVEKSVKVWKIV